ncbi:MAG: DUF2975 domain-containing protein [Bacteroidales bacterium]
MNQPNKNLLNGIRIFFQVMYVLMIIVFSVNVITQVLLLLGNELQISTLTVIQVIENPDITMNIGGHNVQPQAMFSMGAIIAKGVPVPMKISNAVTIMIALVIYILVLRTIRTIIRSVYQGEVFSLQNAQRLKKTGFLLLAELVITYTMTLINSISLHTFDSSNIATFIGMIVGDAASSLIAIAFIFFLASIFKIGINIQEENQSFV